MVESKFNSINYVEGHNNGPALLLLHGGGKSLIAFSSLLPYLTDKYHVFALDLPGHSKSYKNSESIYLVKIITELHVRTIQLPKK